MVVKMTNKDKDFYKYMGKIFGSRLIEKQTNDRIYDDDNKEWYIYIEDNRVLAFISINENKIKNIYATKEKYLEELLNNIKSENKIYYSIVTKVYEKIYEKCGFTVDTSQEYKNFVGIYTKN